MNLNRRILKVLFVALCLLFANGMLQWMVDSDLGVGWPHNAMRNWEQFGLTTLHGHMVTNPGGHDILEHPEIYQGHRAASLYPAYLVGRLFSWTGLHALPFHVVLALLVALSIWYLLGQTETALYVGAIALFCPGYVLWPTVLDPNTNAIIAGVPYVALLWWRLQQPKLSVGDAVFILVLTLAFTSLNWTTVLVHALIFGTLVALQTISWRQLLAYLSAGAVAAGLVAVSSISSKLSGEAHGGGGFSSFLAGYTWGSGGYGNGTNTFSLLLRVAFVNVLALLPLWILLLWAWLKAFRRHHATAFWSLVPVVGSALEVLAMRNYFCHHPWMAAPLLWLGALLSLFMLHRCGASVGVSSGPASPRQRRAWNAALVATFFFGALILLSYREHQRRQMALVSFVRANTSRDDGIAVVRSADPKTAEIADRLNEQFDRWVILLKDLPDERHPTSAAFILSARPLNNGWPVVTESVGQNPAIMGRVSDWFSRNIAHRKPGDRMEIAESYSLYRVPPPFVSVHKEIGDTSARLAGDAHSAAP